MSDTLKLEPSRDSLKLEIAAGIPGDAATVDVGNVVTLDPGEDVTVANVGTTNNAILDFGIPRGADGVDGEVTGPGTTVNNEIVLWNGTSGTAIKRASTNGIIKATSGVIAAAVAGTDYYNPGGTDVSVADGGTGGSGHTEYAVLCGGTTTTNPLQSIASVGTSGQVLTSNGANALPTFQSPASPGGIATIASGSVGTSTSLAITSIPATYSYLSLVLTNVSTNSAAQTILVQLSTNNGSSYVTSGYIGFYLPETGTFSLLGAGFARGPSTAAVEVVNGVVNIFGYHSGPLTSCTFTLQESSGSALQNSGQGLYLSGTAVNALRITTLGGSATFDGGTYALYGIY